MKPPDLRAVIVDDEAPAREVLQNLLTAHPHVRVVGEANSVANATALCQDLRPNLVFLDVQLGDGDGFEVNQCDFSLMLSNSAAELPVRMGVHKTLGARPMKRLSDYQIRSPDSFSIGGPVSRRFFDHPSPNFRNLNRLRWMA